MKKSYNKIIQIKIVNSLMTLFWFKTMLERNKMWKKR